MNDGRGRGEARDINRRFRSLENVVRQLINAVCSLTARLGHRRMQSVWAAHLQHLERPDDLLLLDLRQEPPELNLRVVDLAVFNIVRAIVHVLLVAQRASFTSK